LKDSVRAESWLDSLEPADGEVRQALWEMSVGNAFAKGALKGMLRKRCAPAEVKKILSGG
jgi:hypothetical protein